MIAEIKTKINNLLTLDPGNTTWGTIFDLALGGVRDGLEWLWANKAPLVHDHPEGGGTVGLAFVTSAERAALAPVAPMSVEETDTGLKWFYLGGDPYDSTKWVCNGRPVPAIIPLPTWQTDPDQYTVKRQDAYDSNGHGADLFYHYVFPGNVFSIMYTSVVLPFAGYDLQFRGKARMSTAETGKTISPRIQYKVISGGDVFAEIANYSAWVSMRDALVGITLYTPNVANETFSVEDSSNLFVPASAYSSGDVLLFALERTGEIDTHGGNLELFEGSYLQPAIPAA